MSVDQWEHNGDLIYSGDEGHTLIRDTLEVRLAGLDGFDVKC